MENQTKISKKEEVVGGLLVASAVSFTLLSILFMWAPASHYLERWSDYWEDKSNYSYITIENTERLEEAQKRYERDEECLKKTMGYFGVTNAYQVQSRVNFQEDIEEKTSTTTCYGLKYTKIYTK